MTGAAATLEHLGHGDDWSRIHALVCGLAASGYAAADALIQHGATVSVLDDADTEPLRNKQQILSTLGAEVRLGPGSTDSWPVSPGAPAIDVVVATPGLPPRTPVLLEALRERVPIWSEVELGWRLRRPKPDGTAAPWLCITGTNGKTTTVQMLDGMLRAAGLTSIAVGNVGTPVTEAVMRPTDYDVLAVELSSFQLHWTRSVTAQASVVLNVAPDHQDWYRGSWTDYVQDKGRIYRGTQVACVYNVEDPVTEELVRAAEVADGCRAVGFGTMIPAVGTVGVVDGVIADRAFVPRRQTSAAELATVQDLTPLAPHLLANAVAAAALARAHGVPAAAVRAGLQAFRPDAHRNSTVGVIGGVVFVDDSKATNPHAAQASLSAYEPVVWVAGGLAKGASFAELVVAVSNRLRGVVLLGRDRADIAAALRRHAPDVPVIDVGDRETGSTSVMNRAVEAAAVLAVPGDTVLLAPACASQDMFGDYRARGDAFADAVRRRVAG